MARMKVAQVSKPGGNFEIVEREIPEPAKNQVRIKVLACGVCHSDVLVKEGLWGIQLPRVPGHEVAGLIDAVGSDVKQWKVGQRVGVGWHGATASFAIPAAVESSCSALTRKSPASIRTEATPNTCCRPPRP